VGPIESRGLESSIRITTRPMGNSRQLRRQGQAKRIQSGSSLWLTNRYAARPGGSNTTTKSAIKWMTEGGQRIKLMKP
jgi:hypothetical protein